MSTDPRTKLLLLMGPSGVGKSSIIGKLKNIDTRFVYVMPYTTRTLRPEETDKVCVTAEQMDELERNGELLWINHLYGNRYGTPRGLLMGALSDNRFPVLDWPIARLAAVRSLLSSSLVSVYLRPPSLIDLRSRLKLRGEHDPLRFNEAASELEALAEGRFASDIDLIIENATDQQDHVCRLIYEFYVKSLQGRG